MYRNFLICTERWQTSFVNGVNIVNDEYIMLDGARMPGARRSRGKPQNTYSGKRSQCMRTGLVHVD